MRWEADALAALQAATIWDLARALDEGAFRGEHGRAGFTCPDCAAWSAEVMDDWRWRCDCWPTTTTVSDQRTKVALRRHVAESFAASQRLVELVRPRLRRSA